MKRKLLTIGIILLCVEMSIMPITEAISSENEHMSVPKSCFNGIILNGTMGDGGWYVSPVWITLNFSGSHIFYTIDGGETQEYSGPFVVSTDGHHTVLCNCMNEEGEPMVYSVSFDIDCTTPVIELFSMKRAGIFKWKLSADVSDETSGINRVEFYFNDTFVNTSFAPGPYIVYWKGSMLLLRLKCLLFYHIPFSLFYFYVQPQCIVYDCAGNYVVSPKTSN